MPRGGRRQGTPGKAYSNRTDLMASTKPVATGQVNPTAAGGVTAPTPQPGEPQRPAMLPGPLIGADEIPNLSDPTMRPGEPIMAGVDMGAGPGRSALGPLPPTPADPVRQVLEALQLSYPNPDIERALAQMEREGR